MIRPATLFSLLVALTTGTALAHSGHDAPAGQNAPSASAAAEAVQAPPADGEEERARAYFTDLPVRTQHGDELRFFSDVLRGRRVVINMFHTQCKDACPLTNAKLGELQALITEAEGDDVLLLSITTDPDYDTVERMKAYADSFGAGDNWLFLTGASHDINTIVGRLGHVDRSPEDHLVMFMVGNVPRAAWRKVMPNLPAETIALYLKTIGDGQVR